VWQEPGLAGMPSWARMASLSLSNTWTVKSEFSRMVTQSLQQPQFGSFHTWIKLVCSLVAAAVGGSVNAPTSQNRRFMMGFKNFFLNIFVFYCALQSKKLHMSLRGFEFI